MEKLIKFDIDAIEKMMMEVVLYVIMEITKLIQQDKNVFSLDVRH